MRRGAVRRWAVWVVSAVFVTAGLTGLAACGSSQSEAKAEGPVTLRLGYFPNLTHATPIVGVEKGFFKQELGANVTLDAKQFNAGPAAVEALFADAIDAVYIGPNPAINAWQKSKGQAIKIVAGAASGGAFLVTKPEITTAAQLKGRKIATPQLGNTQDVALRYWLKQQGLTSTKEGGGDVSILPQDNAQAVTAFQSGAIEGAWLPEPHASRLVAAGGKVLVDEKSLWPGGKFVTTHLAVSAKFLKAHPDAVKRLIAGQVATNEFINKNPEEAQKAVSEGIGRLTGKPLDLKQIAASWKSIEFTNDPVASSLREGAKHAEEVGLLEPVDLKGIYDLSLLNSVLKSKGLPEVSS